MATLYLVPTPIGNLEDITLRAIRVLKEVETILAEDTRVTRRLLKHLGIDKPIMSHHQNNEHKTVNFIVDRINSGETMALVSDAGSPAISDPGFLLVRECIANEIPIISLPGATAFVPALTNSGLPTNQFVFEGFLPHKKGRLTRLKLIAEEQRTIVLYESPHRLIKLLMQLEEHCSADRKISVSREITKMFEETVRGTASEIREYFEQKGVKGEFVVVIEGAEDVPKKKNKKRDKNKPHDKNI